MHLPDIPDLDVPKAVVLARAPAGRVQTLGAVTGFGLLEPRYADRVPAREQQRTQYGRALNLGRIAEAIIGANNGWMEPITDLGRESMGLDGHLGAVVQKRLNRVAALDWEVNAAMGDGIDEARAKEQADATREMFRQIPNFSDALVEINWAIWDGRSTSEIGWRIKPGLRDVRWFVQDLWWIHPRRISFGPDRELRIVDGWTGGGDFRAVGYDLREVPGKFMMYKPRLWGEYPEREGLCPRAMYWTFFARFAKREQMVLLELFGRPWRIVKQAQGAIVDDAALEGAWQIIKTASGQTAIRLPPGIELDLETPPAGAGQIHNDSIEHSNRTISKLVLGATGTTDAVPTGLGSSIGDAHLSEEDLVIAADARRLSALVEHSLSDPFNLLNFGEDALATAPTFKLLTVAKKDRVQEGARVKSGLDAGLAIAAEEAYEVIGFRQPKEGEAVLRVVQRPAQLGAAAPAPAPEIVYPVGKAPELGELAAMPEEAIAGTPTAPPAPPAPPQEPLQPASPIANRLSEGEGETMPEHDPEASLPVIQDGLRKLSGHPVVVSMGEGEDIPIAPDEPHGE